MFTRWNPGYFIRETHNYPHARTLRTTFKQKLSDSFKVLSGFESHELLTLKAWLGPLFKGHNAGFLDYSTLFIPYMLGWPARKIFEIDNAILTGVFTVFFFPLVLWPVCVQVVRFAVAAILTMTIGLLISLAVHVIAQFWASGLKQTILNLGNQQANNFSQALASQGLELEDTELLEMRLEQNEENILCLKASKVTVDKALPGGAMSVPFFSYAFNQNENSAFLAVLELNVGEAGAHFEKGG